MNVSATRSSCCLLVILLFSLTPPSPALGTHYPAYKDSLEFLRILYKWNHTVGSVIWLLSFNIIIWDSSMLHKFIPFYWWVVFYCIVTPQFVLFEKTNKSSFSKIEDLLDTSPYSLKSLRKAFFGQVWKNSPKSLIQNMSHKKRRTRLSRCCAFLVSELPIGWTIINQVLAA